MNKFVFSRRVRRGGLMASVCVAGLMQAAPALAQDMATLPLTRGDILADLKPEAQSGAGFVTATDPEPQQATLAMVTPGPQIVSIVAEPEPEILIANPGTTVTARDPNNVTGIGQMIINNGDGTVGLCTATLINPRTVIFAAHCVNSRTATAYGANSGGTPIAFGFENNTRANAAGQPDELLLWITGANANKTNLAQSFYNSNWVNYNNLSLETAANKFLYGDVAMATLDTPAANVPTWALLFSPLPDPGTIGAAGTGYNVGIFGYGGIGTGQAGQTAGSDFRRRAAENVIGALTDLQTFEGFLFGGAPNGLTQNLYFMDFDDPRRGISGASPFDFNAFRDNARVTNGTPTEGITAPGDSGGPLVLQTFSKQVVAGVLSGGYSRFFNGQLPYSYGAVSFYQPLYLYWDWIAENNPYHYVSAKAGNGSWTDPNHWVTTLDPSYMILSGGQLVNGIPTLTGEQKTGTTGDFGQICFQSGGTSDCYDTKTGVETVETRPIGTGSDADASSAEQTAEASTAVTRDDLIPGLTPEAQAVAAALPPATLANGLPGASNFVPNNADPVRTAGTAPRYFDVTLTASGLTTLSAANVTIDRLTIATAGAGLQVDSGASLSSLMNVNQLAGMVMVNGTLSSVGDYSLMGGALLGSGRVNAPFLTSVLGQIAPGTSTTVGTLTIGGNVVLSSGTGLFINLGPNGTSDRLAVVANGTSTGTANLGGVVNFSPAAGYSIKAGDSYTFLTAAGGVTGTFSNPGSMSAILTPKLTYSPNAVSVLIQAGLYRDAVNHGSSVQNAYAQLLDQSRGNAGLAGVYGALDLQNAATIQATLDSWAPRTETLRSSLATVAADNMSRFYRDRLASLDAGDMGGKLAMIGKPVQLASLSMNATGMDQTRTDAGGEVTVQEGRLPESVSGFLAGGYLDGDSRPMAAAVPAGGRDQFDGFYVAGGLETALDDNAVIGLSLSYTDIDGNTASAGQAVSGTLIQGTLYGKAQLGGGVELSTQISAGAFDSKSTRIASLIGTPFTLTGKDSSLVFTGEVTLGKDFDLGSVEFGPRAGLRASHIGFSDIKENGGGPALRLDRSAFNSAQGRLGLELSGKPGASFKPHLRADYVHEFMDAPASFGGTFVGGPGPNAVFGLAGGDKDWFEVGGGLTVSTGNVDLSVGAETTIGRSDVSYQSYRGTVTFHF